MKCCSSEGTQAPLLGCHSSGSCSAVGMTRIRETAQQKPAQPRLGEKNTPGLARTELYASLLSTPRAVKVSAAPVSTVAEGSSIGGRPVPSVASAHL